MNHKLAIVKCPKCNLGFRHFNRVEDAIKALKKHCKKVHNYTYRVKKKKAVKQ